MKNISFDEHIADLKKYLNGSERLDSKTLHDWLMNMVKTYDAELKEVKVDPVVLSVVSKFKTRSSVGIDKYNTTLSDNPGDIVYWLNHLQEEMMDAVNYIERIKHGS